MEYITILNTTLPKIGLGTFAIPESTLPGLISEALGSGYSLFDTALAYPNEHALGSALMLSGADRRSFQIQTKAPYNLLRGHRVFNYFDGRSANNVYRKTLKDLGLENADIYLLHCPFKGFFKHMCQIKRMREECVMSLMGICNISLEQLEWMHSEINILPDVVQVEVHPYCTQKELVSYCHLHGIVVEARSPFAHGDAMDEWNEEIILQQLSEKYCKSVPQVILRWLTQQDIIALPRTSNSQHLKDNINIFDFSLSAEEISQIDSLNRNQSFGVKSSKNI